VPGTLVAIANQQMKGSVFSLLCCALLLPHSSAFASSADDLFAHDTDSMMLGVGGGDLGMELSLMMRIYGVEIGAEHFESYEESVAVEDPYETPMVVLSGEPRTKGRGLVLGVSPLTFGTWFGDTRHCKKAIDCFDVAYAQPYFRWRHMQIRNEQKGERHENSLVVGNRAFVGFGTSPFRLGAYAEVELWGGSETSSVSAGVLFGTGNAHPEPGDTSTTPSVFRTIGSFAGLMVAGAALGLVFGLMDQECQENSCEVQ
jgi:hypothetical protein